MCGCSRIGLILLLFAVDWFTVHEEKLITFRYKDEFPFLYTNSIISAEGTEYTRWLNNIKVEKEVEVEVEVGGVMEK